MPAPAPSNPTGEPPTAAQKARRAPAPETAESAEAPNALPEPERRFLGVLRSGSEKTEALEDNAAVLPEAAATADAEAGTPEPSRRRMFGFLVRRTPDEAPASGTDTLAPLAVEQEKVAAVVGQPQPSITDAEITTRGEAPEGADEPSRRPRLFGFLGKRLSGDASGPSPDDAAPDQEVVLASALPERPAGPAPLRFGEVRLACDAQKRDLGREVARSPGPGTYRLYDTQPNGIEPRVQFITGFKDKCPRQFLGALALFGSAQVHEAKRYDRRNKTAYSATDNAYEAAKRRACGVGKGKPCPEGRYDRLIRDVGFLTVYPSFGATRPWMEIIMTGGNRAVTHVYGR
ncbi:hypothetical protein AIOL_000180 [Candidatus Rhodobacter oscarellae]|uniref:Uncharacterized protein n=1 Tax=Candidatus Rhodobacter oscarellae TaxID=1675527 RepID=A0A0J9EB71_9RHOB|nr:hypothetical protein [Candidatus Rhodobacter lobularis]KMW60030.1 hypothetical protein AIOL_000180 [Candidatus Rhodobacter lobularis]